jgi:hypothetical protein
MSSLSTLIPSNLSLNEFSSFSEFEKAVLAKDKTESLLSTLELGLRSANLSQAFSLGYRCALQRLCPELNQKEWAAFCVTEESGAHPKKLKTTVSAKGVLNGAKSFVSMADRAKQLLIIAVEGYAEDRPILKAVQVELPVIGLDLTVLPSMGMLPGVAHGKLVLNEVQGSILKGDGYLDFNKKFRSIEDAHLLMAFTSLILSKVVRCKLNDNLIDDCMVIITSLLNLEFDDKPFNVLQLSGLYKNFEFIQAKFEADLLAISLDFKDEWLRDSKVFRLAESIREAKRALASSKILK